MEIVAYDLLFVSYATFDTFKTSMLVE